MDIRALIKDVEARNTPTVQFWSSVSGAPAEMSLYEWRVCFEDNYFVIEEFLRDTGSSRADDADEVGETLDMTLFRLATSDVVALGYVNDIEDVDFSTETETRPESSSNGSDGLFFSVLRYWDAVRADSLNPPEPQDPKTIQKWWRYQKLQEEYAEFVTDTPSPVFRFNYVAFLTAIAGNLGLKPEAVPREIAPKIWHLGTHLNWSQYRVPVLVDFNVGLTEGHNRCRDYMLSLNAPVILLRTYPFTSKPILSEEFLDAKNEDSMVAAFITPKMKEQDRAIITGDVPMAMKALRGMLHMEKWQQTRLSEILGAESGDARMIVVPLAEVLTIDITSQALINGRLLTSYLPQGTFVAADMPSVKNEFRIRPGDKDWTIAFKGGVPIKFPDHAAMKVIAVLLREPQRKWTGLDLVLEAYGHNAGFQAEPDYEDEDEDDDDETDTTRKSGDNVNHEGLILDLSTVPKVKERLAKLPALIESASRNGDAKRHRDLLSEKIENEEWLKKATDGIGRTREIPAKYHIAAKNLTQNIRRTLERIAFDEMNSDRTKNAGVVPREDFTEGLSPIAFHLDGQIKTGRCYFYSDEDTAWLTGTAKSLRLSRHPRV